MTEAELPSDVVRFLRAHIRTSTQLEVLMVTHAEPQRWWTPQAINNQLRLTVEAVTGSLQLLVESGLVEARTSGQPQYRYGPRSSDDAATTDRLAELLGSRFHAVVAKIYSERRNKGERAT